MDRAGGTTLSQRDPLNPADLAAIRAADVVLAAALAWEVNGPAAEQRLRLAVRALRQHVETPRLAPLPLAEHEHDGQGGDDEGEEVAGEGVHEGKG
jgi:hypothetical protein